MAAAGVAQFAERLGFNLADTLARHCEILPHFLERVLAAVFQAEAHLDDLLLARRERLEYLRRLLPQVQIDHRVGRRQARLVDQALSADLAKLPQPFARGTKLGTMIPPKKATA